MNILNFFFICLVSDGGDHEKPSKKDLLGRRKDKKEKKDRGYAALEGESSPEEDTDTKSVILFLFLNILYLPTTPNYCICIIVTACQVLR